MTPAEALLELQYLAEHSFNGQYKERAEELAEIVRKALLKNEIKSYK